MTDQLMSQEEISARANAAYDAMMREAAGWRRSYEQHALRLILLIYLCAGSLTVIVAGFLVWLLS